MRGREEGGNLIGSVHREEPVPAGHRLRPIRTLMDEGGLDKLSERGERPYAGKGCALTLPEISLRATRWRRSSPCTASGCGWIRLGRLAVS